MDNDNTLGYYDYDDDGLCNGGDCKAADRVFDTEAFDSCWGKGLVWRAYALTEPSYNASCHSISMETPTNLRPKALQIREQ